MNTYTTIDPQNYLDAHPDASRFALVMETPQFPIVQTTQGWRNSQIKPLTNDFGDILELDRKNLVGAYWEAAREGRGDSTFSTATALTIVSF